MIFFLIFIIFFHCFFSSFTFASFSSSPNWFQCPHSPTHFQFSNSSNSKIILFDRSLSVNLTGISDQIISDGTIEITVIYEKQRIYTTSQSLSQGFSQLPIQPGKINFHEKILIPSLAPNGIYEIFIQFIDQQQKILNCIIIQFQLENYNHQKIIPNENKNNEEEKNLFFIPENFLKKNHQNEKFNEKNINLKNIEFIENILNEQWKNNEIQLNRENEKKKKF